MESFAKQLDNIFNEYKKYEIKNKETINLNITKKLFQEKINYLFCQLQEINKAMKQNKRKKYLMIFSKPLLEFIQKDLCFFNDEYEMYEQIKELNINILHKIQLLNKIAAEENLITIENKENLVILTEFTMDYYHFQLSLFCNKKNNLEHIYKEDNFTFKDSTNHQILFNTFFSYKFKELFNDKEKNPKKIKKY